MGLVNAALLTVTIALLLYALLRAKVSRARQRKRFLRDFYER